MRARRMPLAKRNQICGRGPPDGQVEPEDGARQALGWKHP